MTKILDPKNDVVFQKIFGMQKNKHILISFLNSILNLQGDNAIKDVKFEEKHLDVSMIVSEKLSILDLHVSTESNLDINIEIQLINQYNMIKRTVFYMAKMLLNQLKKGENYSLLNRTVTINILNFDYLQDKNYIKCYSLFEKHTKDPLTDLIEIIFVELPKFSRYKRNDNIIEFNKEYNEKLYKWLTFLSNPSGKENEEFMKSDVEIKEAMDVLYEISGDKETIMLAEMREKAIMDEQSRLRGAIKEGLDKGLKEGLVKGKKDGLKEIIIENLRELGNIPPNLINNINEQDDIATLKIWNKLSVISESIGEFEEKIKD